MMAELKIALWNCGGLRRSSPSTSRKMAFFDKELQHNAFHFAAFVETHHRDDDDFPLPLKLRHQSSQYHIIHTTATKTHRSAGIIILLHTSYQVLQCEDFLPGRLMNVLIRHKASKTDFCISVT